MLHVILLILKILGITLLSILCLLLLILTAVLFVAFSYQLSIKKDENIHVSATVSWLFRIVSVWFLLDIVDETKQELKICLFGIPIIKPLEKNPGKEKRKKTGKKKRKCTKVPKEDAVSAEKLPASEPSEEPKYSAKATSESAEATKKLTTDCDKNVSKRIKKAIANLKQKAIDFRKTIHDLIEKKDKYLGFLTQEEHKRAESAAMQELLYILKHIRPRKLEGTVRFGFDDPSQTGKIYGAACVLYGWYPKKFEVIPEFEHEVMECDVRLKGKIRLYVFAAAALKLLLNKDVRNMYKDWKQL